VNGGRKGTEKGGKKARWKRKERRKGSQKKSAWSGMVWEHRGGISLGGERDVVLGHVSTCVNNPTEYIISSKY
jgi:hypothetical protein